MRLPNSWYESSIFGLDFAIDSASHNTSGTHTSIPEVCNKMSIAPRCWVVTHPTKLGTGRFAGDSREPRSSHVFSKGGIVLFRLIGAPIRWHIVLLIAAIAVFAACANFSLFATIVSSL